MEDTALLAAISARTGPADANGCSLWIGAIDTNGTCSVAANAKKFVVQRVLWYANHPDEPLDKLHIIQTICGNRRCVNNDHLRKVPRKRELDHAAAWIRLQRHGVRLENGCLVAKKAYTHVYVGGMNMGIHKAAFMLHNNLAVCPHGLNESGVSVAVRHMCGSSLCFEPTHLAYGTQRENCYEDKIAQGTLLRGARHPNTSITEELARKIKRSKLTTRPGQAGHETRKQRAERFGVPEHIVSSIDLGQSWAHLSEGADNSVGTAIRAKSRERRARARARIWTSDMYQEAHKRLQQKLVIITTSAHVDSPCNLWTGSKDTEGYGVVNIYGKPMKAHLLACEIKLGGPLGEGQVCRHLCGIKLCCASEHLEPGSPRENSIDRIRHGTHPCAKLTEDVVREIRSTRGKDGLTQLQRSKKYNIHLTNMWSVEMGHSYKHVT